MRFLSRSGFINRSARIIRHCCSVKVSQTATIDVSHDGSIEDVDCGGIGAVGIDNTLSRTTIEVTIKGSSVEIHFNITFDIS